MASKRRLRRKECGKKRRFATVTEALDAMHALIRRGCARGGWLHVYQCNFCRGYHYGHARLKRV